MLVSQKYKKIFGSIDNLKNRISWTTGVSNTVEYLLWHTNSILGISKTKLIKEVINIVVNNPNKKREELYRIVDNSLKFQLIKTEKKDKYAKPQSGYCTPREALRRIKFFSEDYLNKEFDIFFSLVSDEYLDQFYNKFIKIRGGGSWSIHGNSSLFAKSTGIRKMQMDNIAYNEKEKILVANELKLGSIKNPDQILKYAYMFNRLRDKNFIENNSRFLLLFIESEKHKINKRKIIEDEKKYCEKKEKHFLLDSDILKTINDMQINNILWFDILEFNINFLSKLTEKRQVEKKLICGFNESLKEKYLLHTKIVDKNFCF